MCKVCRTAFICRCSFVGNRLTHYRENIFCSLCELKTFESGFKSFVSRAYKSLSVEQSCEENVFQQFQSDIDRPSTVPWVMTREQSIERKEVMRILQGGDVESNANLPNDHPLILYLRNKHYKQLWLLCS